MYGWSTRDGCSKTETFSGLKDRYALKDFCMWAFDDKINKETVFIAHNGGNYDSQLILSYLVEITEYPELLANGAIYYKCTSRRVNPSLLTFVVFCQCR